MVALTQDLRYAVRLLRKNIGFTAVGVLTIAVGVAATTTIFSVIEGTLLRPWPFPGSERIVAPRTTEPATGAAYNVNYADYEDWRDAGVFESVAAYRSGSVDLAGAAGEPERVRSMQVSQDFFDVLGTAPTLGRAPAPDEFSPAAPAVVVVSYGLWQSRFGGDPAVLGRTVRLYGEPATVIGVTPPELDVLPAQIFVPLRPSERALVFWRDRDNFAFSALARLRPGQTLAEAETRLEAIAARIAADHPQIREGTSADLLPLTEWVVGEEMRTTLWAMLGAVGFVLLIGCVNLANLLLARATRRGRELAVRGALGAGRGRLVRQLLAEGLVLALAGGALGALLSIGGIELLVALAPAEAPRIEQVGMNVPVLAFALFVSVASALVFGLLPALRATRIEPGRAMADGSRGSTEGPRGRRVRGALVAVELALAVVLLAGAGLMIRSVASLSDVDPGFDVENMIAFRVTLPSARYETRDAVANGYERLREELEAVPGVESAVALSNLPLGGPGSNLFRMFLPEGRPEPPAGEEVPGMWDVVQPGYFRTLGLPLLAGRGFAVTDAADAVPVMVVNREFAENMFGSVEAALNRRVRSWRDENLYREVVGVVDDVRYFGAGDETRGVVYVPHRQNAWQTMAVAVRTAGDPGDLTGAVRTAVRSFDPNIALASFTTMRRIFEDSVAGRRFAATLLTTFATLALILAAIGIYGVLSYAVAQRTQEFGVRMALGARAGDVRRTVLREAGVAVAIGSAFGLAGAFALARVLSTALSGVSASDPVTFGAVVAVLAAVALAASWVPAARATRVDPVRAIRAE